MKIGLLTVYYANYGSYYQAASLAKQLEALGHECEIINASIRGKYAWKFLLGAMGERCLPKLVTDWVANKISAFRTYHAMQPELSSMKIGPLVFSAKKLSARYDCILVGSDELWSATNPIMFFIPAYFGIGITCPKISYATSAVTLKDPPKEIECQMAEGIKGFSYISVRDIETQNWVKKWTGKDVPITLDPTLLYPYFGSTGKGGDGIVVYGEHFSNSHIELIKTYARKHNMLIHALCWKQEWCDDFIEVTSAQNLQNCFAEADFCVVSTFHGTVFSLLNRRPFAAFSAPMRSEKITRLLEVVGMTNCFWSDTCMDELAFRGNYDQFDKTVSIRREDSLNCLKEALQCAEDARQKG